MNKFEALYALTKGLTVRHSSFASDEWIREYDSGRYEFEDGCRCKKGEFWKYRTEPSWDRGWIIVDAKDCATLSGHLFGRGLLDIESMLVCDEMVGCFPHDSMLSDSLKLMKEFNGSYTGILPTHNYKPVPTDCNGMKKPAQFHRESWRRK